MAKRLIKIRNSEQQQEMMTCLWKLIVHVSVVLRKTVGGSD